MHLQKQQMYWITQVLGWSAFTSGNLLFNYLSKKSINFKDILYAILIIVIGISLSHIVRYVFKLFGWQKESILRILHKLALLSALMGTLNICLLYLFSSLWDSGLINNYTKALFFAQAGTFGTIYFIWGIIYFVVFFFRNFKKEEIRNLKNQSEIKEIQLNKFKSQLNPHFIFNSMNGLRALIDEDTQKAKQGITQLSNILRHTLTLEKNRLIHLEDEMKLVEDYLNLEKIRLEERLTYKIDVSEDSYRFMVPPMIIQTLAENAVKHGVSQLIKGGILNINCSVKDGKLKVEIVNSGQYNPNKSSNESSGFGIENSKQRLKIIFNNTASFTIKNLNDEEVITTLIIPKT